MRRAFGNLVHAVLIFVWCEEEAGHDALLDGMKGQRDRVEVPCVELNDGLFLMV